MTKRTSIHAEAAKMIRANLKKHGIPATVRARTASMMTAIDINVTDQSPGAIKEIEDFCHQFQYGHFNGMEDIYEYSNRRDLPQVKYVSVHNNFSPELRAEAWDWIRTQLTPDYPGLVDYGSVTEDTPAPVTIDDERAVYRVLADRFGRFGFWAPRKPRVRAA